jgi:hypothetical protein
MKRRSRLWELFFPFITNERSKEVHRVKTLSPNCHIDIMANGKYRTRRKVRKLLADGYNGCRWCFNEKDNG